MTANSGPGQPFLAGGPDDHVVGLVQAQAARTARALAVTDADGEMSYAQLNGSANRLARRLRAAGVRREGAVGLYLDRSRDLLVAFLAVLKAGGTAHLLDPRWQSERTSAALSCAAPLPLLLRPGTPPPAAAGVRLIEWSVDDSNDGDEVPDARLRTHPDSLAYVVYTSGSTGGPKPVGVTHRSVSHCIRTHVTGHRITAADRSSWLASPGSSACVGELWPYLASGASVHAGPAEVVASPAELRDWLVRHEITKAFLATPVAQEIGMLPWPADPPLQLVTVGGDRMLRWLPATLPFEVAVSYGSAEANGVTSCLVPWEGRCTSRTATAADRRSPPPVGRPWADVRLLVLDDRLRRRDAGQVGELYVASPELTRGYLGRPGLTAVSLLPNPYASVPGERMYRTGDLGALDETGVLHHRGRVGQLVKVRGHRVDPGDAEAALLRHDQVSAAAVVASEDREGGTRLVAYVELRAANGAPPATPSGLRSFLWSRLPDHLVPESVTVVDRIPRSANGKLDRRALPAVAGPPGRGNAAPIPAGDGRDRLEARVLELWRSMLGVEEPCLGDHFIEAGGTSIIAGRLIAALRLELGVSVRLREFMRKPTLESLIEQVRSHS
jgi:amino acid adenylation domain-containing protein